MVGKEAKTFQLTILNQEKIKDKRVHSPYRPYS